MSSSLFMVPVWRQSIKKCADPPRARHHLQQFGTSPAATMLAGASIEQARIGSALFSGSAVLADLLLAHPDWLSLVLDAGALQHPRREQGLRREVESWLGPLLKAAEYGGAFARLREFKQREMLRIAARDLARLSTVSELTQELSSVADICLSAVWRLCSQRLEGSFGRPYHLNADECWEPASCCVFGLGKLGGGELNYSSDVDIIVVYSEEGHTFKTPPAKGGTTGRRLTNHDFFTRLVKDLIAEVTRQAPEGVLYRVDLRLRPEGDAGPLARSLAGYENYYAQWGQTWERMMLIKARCVAGDEMLGHEFAEMIQSFRFPRSINARVLNEVASMKDRIENENLRSGELDRNVKLGHGGIREVEFIVQSQQLLHAGKNPFLQGAQTLPAL